MLRRHPTPSIPKHLYGDVFDVHKITSAVPDTSTNVVATESKRKEKGKRTSRPSALRDEDGVLRRIHNSFFSSGGGRVWCDPKLVPAYSPGPGSYDVVSRGDSAHSTGHDFGIRAERWRRRREVADPSPTSAAIGKEESKQVDVSSMPTSRRLSMGYAPPRQTKRERTTGSLKRLADAIFGTTCAIRHVVRTLHSIPIYNESTAFDAIDQDCDGVLNRKEFVASMRRLGVAFGKAAHVLFDRIDLNGDDRIDRKEFTQALSFASTCKRRARSNTTRASTFQIRPEPLTVPHVIESSCGETYVSSRAASSSPRRRRRKVVAPTRRNNRERLDISDYALDMRSKSVYQRSFTCSSRTEPIEWKHTSFLTQNWRNAGRGVPSRDEINTISSNGPKDVHKCHTSIERRALTTTFGTSGRFDGFDANSFRLDDRMSPGPVHLSASLRSGPGVSFDARSKEPLHARPQSVPPTFDSSRGFNSSMTRPRVRCQKERLSANKTGPASYLPVVRCSSPTFSFGKEKCVDNTQPNMTCRARTESDDASTQQNVANDLMRALSNRENLSFIEGRRVRSKVATLRDFRSTVCLCGLRFSREDIDALFDRLQSEARSSRRRLTWGHIVTVLKKSAHGRSRDYSRDFDRPLTSSSRAGVLRTVGFDSSRPALPTMLKTRDGILEKIGALSTLIAG